MKLLWIRLLGLLILLGGVVGIIHADSPLSSYTADGVYQSYEGGIMLWDSSNETIWVIYDDGYYVYFPYSTYINLPDNSLTALDGLVTPIRGFGRVWYNYPEVRERVGYAIGTELAHVMTWEDYGGYGRVNIPSGDHILLRSWGLWQYDRSAPSPSPSPIPTEISQVDCNAPTQFYTACPDMPYVAYQPFENGFMLYYHGTGEIRVFYNDGTTSRYSSYMYGSLEENPIRTSPPAGYFSPILGLGKVWGNYSYVREKLGWAIAPEAGWYIPQTTDRNKITYIITIPDGRTIQLNVFREPSWRVID
ncbi:MAG: hypothetical protein AAFV93_02685 [Chloroflexota bacterium]